MKATVQKDFPQKPTPAGSGQADLGNLLNSIIDRVNDGLVAIDTGWHYVYVNQKAAEMLNRQKPEELNGKHIWTEYPEGIDKPFYEAYHRAMESQEMVHLEEHFEPWDRWFENRIYPSADGLTIYFSDITERKRAEKKLIQTEERLRLAVNAAKVGLWDWDLQTNAVYFSPEWKRQIGYEDHEIPNEFVEWQNRVHPDDIEKALRTIEKFIAQRSHSFLNEFRFRHKDGSYRWILAQADLVYHEQGYPMRMLGSHIDVTESKQASKAVERSEKRFRTLIEKSLDLLLLFDENGIVQYSSPSSSSMLGFTPEEMVQRGRLQGVHPDDLERAVAQLNWIYEHPGEPYTIETRIQHKDGSWRTIQGTSRNLLHDPAVRAVIANVHDITAKKQAEDALRESEAKYRTLIEHAADGIFLSTSDGHFLDVNSAGCMMLGYSREEIIGTHLSNFIAPENLTDKPLELDKVISGALVIRERTLRHKDGALIPVEVNAASLPNGDVLDIVRDITERKKAQEAVERYTQRLTILRKIDREIASSRSSKEIVDAVLPRIQELIPCQHISVPLFNETASEVSIFAVQSEISSDIKADMRAPLVENEYLAMIKSGRTSSIPDLEKIDGPRSKLGEQYLKEGLRSILIGPLMVQEKLIGSLVLAARIPGYFTCEHEEIVQAIANQVAIALYQSRLLEEIEQTNRELEQRVAQRAAQLETKNRELETFTYSVSHDLKTPLRGINGYSRLLLEDHADRLDEEGKMFLANVRRGASQMNQLIDDLLAYSRLERRLQQSGVIDARALAEALITERQAEILDRGVVVSVEIPEMTITADPDAVTIALRNLLDNALKFTRAIDRPLIEIGGRTTESADIFGVHDKGIGLT